MCCDAEIDLAYQYLVPEKRATTISNIVAVALTLALPRVYILLKRCIPSILHLYHHLAQLHLLRRFCQVSKLIAKNTGAFFRRKPLNASAEEHDLEHTTGSSPAALQSSPADPPDNRLIIGLCGTIQQATTTENAVSQLARHHLAMPPIRVGTSSPNAFRQVWTNIRDEPRGSTYILFSMLSLFAIYIGLQTISISSSFMIGGSAATIKQAACAVYITRQHALTKLDEIMAFSARHSYQSSLSESALSYAASCYQTARTSTSCDIALTRSIPYHLSTTSSCPFPAPTMCKLGNDSVHTLDTGFINARILGINSASNFEFRRRTTCSPVLDNNEFVWLETSSNNKTVHIGYLYGTGWKHMWRRDSRRSRYSIFDEVRHADYNDRIDQDSGVDNDNPDLFLNKAYDVQSVNLSMLEYCTDEM